MKQIRKGVFETNSSSCHSLSISKKIKIDVISNDDVKLNNLGSGDYGWGVEYLSDWKEKADYLGVEAKDDEYKSELLLEGIKLAYPNTEISYDLRKNERWGGFLNGYIDHQSSGEIWNYLNTAEDVYQCLFSNSEIIIDNDNH